MNTHSDSIDALLRRVACSDRKALDILYQQHAPRFYAYVRRFGHSHHVSEDLLQTMFLRLWKYRQSFRGDSGEAWLFTILRNCMRNVRSSPLPGTGATEMAVSDPYQQFMADRIEARLQAKLESLPSHVRDAVLLSRFSHMTMRDIADLLRLSEANVKVIIHRGLRALREVVDEE